MVVRELLYIGSVLPPFPRVLRPLSRLSSLTSSPIVVFHHCRVLIDPRLPLPTLTNPHLSSLTLAHHRPSLLTLSHPHPLLPTHSHPHPSSPTLALVVCTSLTLCDLLGLGDTLELRRPSFLHFFLFSSFVVTLFTHPFFLIDLRLENSLRLPSSPSVLYPPFSVLLSFLPSYTFLLSSLYPLVLNSHLWRQCSVLATVLSLLCDFYLPSLLLSGRLIAFYLDSIPHTSIQVRCLSSWATLLAWLHSSLGDFSSPLSPLLPPSSSTRV